jgi:hypothetical protein
VISITGLRAVPGLPSFAAAVEQPFNDLPEAAPH